MPARAVSLEDRQRVGLPVGAQRGDERVQDRGRAADDRVVGDRGQVLVGEVLGDQGLQPRLPWTGRPNVVGAPKSRGLRFW